MSKASSQTSQGKSSGATRSTATLLQNQNTLGPHLCVQREATGTPVNSAAPSLVRDVVNSPGQPLDDATRSRMEPRLGHDFSQVRVHNDDRAAESARSISAKAYTAGSHVVFGEGHYSPGNSSGQSLLAHELTHVAQQASGPVEGTPVAEGLSVSDPGDRFEQAARQTSRAIASCEPAEEAPKAPTAAQPDSGRLTIQRVDDNSPAGNYTQRQTAASEGATSAAQASATASEVSAATGIFSSLIGAYTAIRSANFAERSAQASEDPPTAEPTNGGISVTDADIPEIKGLEDGKKPDTRTVQQGTDVETPNAPDISTSSGTDVESTKGEGKDARKSTSTYAKSTTNKGGSTTKRSSTSEVFKSPDERDTVKTYKVLNINQGENDSADFFVSIRSAGDDIKDGGTEPPEARGYLGGSSESNASVSFKARAGQHNKDGSATVRLLIGGTNTPPRKSLQSSGFFGGGGPKVNEKYAVQRFSAVVQFDAKPDVRAPFVDTKRLKGGIGTAVAGNGAEDGSALVTVSLPETYLPPGKKKDKK